MGLRSFDTATAGTERERLMMQRANEILEL